jgi:DNA-binding XRE family transcriptional regulator
LILSAIEKENFDPSIPFALRLTEKLRRPTALALREAGLNTHEARDRAIERTTQKLQLCRNIERKVIFFY